MSRSSEETTKGIVANKLSEIPGYPKSQDEKLNGIVWYKEDSFKNSENDKLTEIFKKASKSQTEQSKGTPDFLVFKDNSNCIIVIECKADTIFQSRFADVHEYVGKGYSENPDDTRKFAIDGALWYAQFLNDNYDVIAIACSGQNKTNFKITSFILPQRAKKEDIYLLEDCDLQYGLKHINEYEQDINISLGRFNERNETIIKNLRSYTLACANFLRVNGIEDNSKAGFVSAIILGLTNKESELYKLTKKSIDDKKMNKSKLIYVDLLGRQAVTKLREALEGHGKKEDDDFIPGIWDIDNIPEGKRKALKKFYNTLLDKNELKFEPKGTNSFFKDGNTVLSTCIYSLYENVIELIEHYSGIDIMGEFYTTFLRFTKGNAKEKGIVLTPKHITDLFCDLAEHFSGRKLSENDKILDICTGTGAFLISALNKIKDNINKENISESVKEERYGKAQKNSLIGVESDPSMFSLAYANMRFHGDGKSNLFNCSSLLKDSFFSKDNRAITYDKDGNSTKLAFALKQFGDIDFAFINPPYSLKEDKKDKKQEKKESDFPIEIRGDEHLQERKEISIQKGQSELDFVASMLYYLKKGGIGIAIVPMSCAGNSGKALRKDILKYHTLLAVTTMPPQLFFDSHVGTSTCIMVFKAHEPHNTKMPVFFGRWIDDGFKVIPHNGRKETLEWGKIRKQWLNQLKPGCKPNNNVFVWKEIKTGDEALAEAYIDIDYSKLTKDDFILTLKKYALFQYMDENGILED